ncbi:hypothetical protein PAMP_021248 [Pampus punctatissimus]
MAHCTRVCTFLIDYSGKCEEAENDEGEHDHQDLQLSEWRCHLHQPQLSPLDDPDWADKGEQSRSAVPFSPRWDGRSHTGTQFRGREAAAYWECCGSNTGALLGNSSMPVQQITVVPARETANNGKSAPRSKDKNEGRKAPGRSGSRSSNISKGQKKQVKRRHRRKRNSCTAFDCVETNAKHKQTERSDRSLSSDRSERGEKRERSFRNRKELPPRLRCTGAPQSDSTSEDEVQREARSWSKEKARRAQRRSGSKGGEDKADMELQSVDSNEGKESQPLVEDSGGLKKRHSSRGSMRRDGHMSQREGSQNRDKEKSCRDHKSRSPAGSTSIAEDGQELITKRYQEKGSGNGDMSVPTPQKCCGVNGGMPQHCSDDSELEVCRSDCLNQWIKSSDTRCCELCKFDFIMETKLKPLRKWERLHMSKSERRKIFCSVLFHLIAIVCMLWSVYILVKRTTEEIRLGKNGVLEWPFWTKLIVVAIGFTGGLIFMYIQCKVYLQLWRRLKAFNRIITVQNCPEKNQHNSQAEPSALTNGRHETVEVPVSPAPAPEPQMDSDMSVEAAVAPTQNPV